MDHRKRSIDGASSASGSSRRFWGNFRKKLLGRKPEKTRETEIYPSECKKCLPPWFERDRFLQPDSQSLRGFTDAYYDMNNGTRGRVYIFNHESFKKDVGYREGSAKDVTNLLESLPKLGFRPEDIKCFKNLSRSDIDDKLDEISKDDHTEMDMLMVFVLTHGKEEDMIYAYDGEYSVRNIWKHFTADKCETLKGKPKIFFIVACKGNKTDDGSRIVGHPRTRKMSVTETDAVRCQTEVSYSIPVCADFLIIYSTIEGFYSYRNPESGTWYIESFCQELKRFDQSRLQFMDFLTSVSRRVAITYSTYCEDPVMNNKKQCPFITSSLTKIIEMDIKSNNNAAIAESKRKQRPRSLNR